MNTVTSKSTFEHNDLRRSNRRDSGVTGRPDRTGWLKSLVGNRIAQTSRELVGSPIGGMIALYVLSSGMINLLLQLR